MMVAPNSDIARAHASAIPVASDGQAIGTVKRQNVPHGDTPSVCDTSS